MMITNPMHRANKVDLDVITNPQLKRPDRLNLMIDMLNEVAEGRWRKGAANTPEALQADVPTCQITFDLSEWQHDDAECGFTACAIGHACMDKRFNDLGLTNQGGGGKTCSVVQGGPPYYGGFYAWAALEEFFGISDRDLWFLFADDEYPPKATPSLVAQRIELYLRRLIEDVQRDQ